MMAGTDSYLAILNPIGITTLLLQRPVQLLPAVLVDRREQQSESALHFGASCDASLRRVLGPAEGFRWFQEFKDLKI